MLEKLKELISNNVYDKSSECLLESANIDYEEVEARDWVDEGKYQYRDYVVKIEGNYYSFSESRSGSYYSDWYYAIDNVCMYTPDTRYKVEYTFPNKIVAQKFASFISDSAEDLINELDIFEEEITYNYDLGEGTVELKLSDK